MAEIGLLISLNLAVAVALKPAAGWAADRLGVKRTLVAAIWLRSLVTFGLVFAVLPWHLFAIRAVHGVSIALRDPSVDVLIAEHGGKRAVASAFAWYQTAKSAAGALGKALAGVLITLTSGRYSMVFLVALALSMAPALVVGRYVKEPVIEHSPPPEIDGEPAPLEVPPRLLPFVGLAALVAVTAEMLHGLLPILAVEYAGLSEAETGMLYLVSTVTVIVCGPVFGWLSDHVSRRLVLGVRSVANVGSSVLFLFVPNPPGMLAGKALDDAGKAAFRPAWGSVMAELSGHRPGRRARTMSQLSMGEDVGAMIGPILAGLLWGAWGVGALFGVRIILAVATEVYAGTVTRRLGR